MSKHKKHIPVPDPEKSEEGYTFPSASMSDLNGLIPASVSDKDDRESYSDVITYIPRSKAEKNVE